MASYEILFVNQTKALAAFFVSETFHFIVQSFEKEIPGYGVPRTIHYLKA